MPATASATSSSAYSVTDGFQRGSNTSIAPMSTRTPTTMRPTLGVAPLSQRPARGRDPTRASAAARPLDERGHEHEQERTDDHEPVVEIGATRDLAARIVDHARYQANAARLRTQRQIKGHISADGKGHDGKT